MAIKIILNPYSNRWRAKERWPLVERLLAKYEVPYSLDVSAGPGHMEHLAKEAVRSGFTTVVAAGGDGTIGEIINGMLKAPITPLSLTCGIIPLGTANDLIYNLKMPLDLEESVQIIAHGYTRMLDVCQANDRYFINNSAVGLEPLVTTIQQEIKSLKGIPRYLAAALRAIAQNPVWQARVTWDQSGFYEGPLTLLTVGNGARTGGLFFMSPNADPFDGYLTAVLAFRPSSMSILTLLPKTMTPKGKFIQAPGIREIRAKTISIELSPPSPAHCDGELFSRFVSSVAYSILPQAIRILSPCEPSL